jgi:hypothetical protein
MLMNTTNFTRYFFTRGAIFTILRQNTHFQHSEVDLYMAKN